METRCVRQRGLRGGEERGLVGRVASDEAAVLRPSRAPRPQRGHEEAFLAGAGGCSVAAPPGGAEGPAWGSGPVPGVAGPGEQSARTRTRAPPGRAPPAARSGGHSTPARAVRGGAEPWGGVPRPRGPAPPSPTHLPAEMEVPVDSGQLGGLQPGRSWCLVPWGWHRDRACPTAL